MSYRIRAAGPDDFRAFYDLAKLTGGGFTNLPAEKATLEAKLERSEAAREIFGEEVVEHYLNAARVEQETYDSIVHPWDRERYLERG